MHQRVDVGLVPAYRLAIPVSLLGGLFSLVINDFHASRTNLPLETIVPNCFSRGSVPVFLKKPITTCDFLGGGMDPLFPIRIRQKDQESAKPNTCCDFILLDNTSMKKTR